MNNNKNIFDSFRENAKHLEETPSDRAWQRLEARLQEQQQPAKMRTLMTRRWAIAASLLVVLSVLSVLSTFLVQSKTSFAEAVMSTKEMGEEQLVMIDAIPYNVAQLNKNYATASIEEGNTSTKLKAAINYFYDEKRSTNTTDQSDSLLKSETKSTTTPILDTIIQSFDWLLGVWKGNVEGGTSVEKWQKDRNTLYGTGYVVQNADTTFMERMKLVQKGEDWYYVLQLDAYSNSLAYKLAYYSDNQAIFTNKEGKFPKQVVLRRNAENEFSTQLVASDGISLSPRELDFLTKRNVLLVDKTVRNLVKI